MECSLLNGAPLSDAERNELRARVQRDGDATIARRIGIARGTLHRLLAGLDTHQPTRIAARLHLSQKW